MRKLRDDDKRIAEQCNVQCAKIYENGTLIFEGKHRVMWTYGGEYIVISEDMNYVIIEPAGKLTFVHVEQ